MTTTNIQPAISPRPTDLLSPRRAHERQPTVRSRANITTACLACKKRKRKCLGGRPCPHCASVNIACYYEAESDRRRKAFNEKARAETNFQKQLLDGLLRVLKGDRSQIVLDLVRSDASLEEIAEQVKILEEEMGEPLSQGVTLQLRRAPASGDPGDPGDPSPSPSLSTKSSAGLTNTRKLEIENLISNNRPKSPIGRRSVRPCHDQGTVPETQRAASTCVAVRQPQPRPPSQAGCLSRPEHLNLPPILSGLDYRAPVLDAHRFPGPR